VVGVTWQSLLLVCLRHQTVWCCSIAPRARSASRGKASLPSGPVLNFFLNIIFWFYLIGHFKHVLFSYIFSLNRHILDKPGLSSLLIRLIRSLVWSCMHCSKPQHNVTQYNTLQHTAMHCNTLPYSATSSKTLKHAATRWHAFSHISAPGTAATSSRLLTRLRLIYTWDVYMYVYIYMYIYIYVYVYVYVYICVYICICIYTWDVYLYMYMYCHVHTCKYICICIHTWEKYKYVRYLHACVHINTRNM